MKKNYTRLIKSFIVLLALFTLKLNAQLSGIVTVNSGAPTSGTNYQSFTALANALNSSGVNGTLIVNVTSASGYTEQPMFNTITGASSTNTITINGNGTNLTFSSTNSSQPWTLGLTGASYMTFNNLNVSATGSNAYACVLSGGANYNTFSGCSFSVSLTGTSTNQIPVVLSGSNNYYYNMSNSGNYNTWTTCTVTGGYYGFSMMGNSSSPYNIGNRILSCNINDTYFAGIYEYFYQKNYQFKNNTIKRLVRTNSTTTYGIYSYYNEGTMIEGNRIQNMFDANLNSTNTFYGIYVYWNTAGGGKANPITIRNNLISDIKHNGTIYGIMARYIDGYVYHNTLSFDNTTSTGGSVYGLYCYTQSNYEMDVRNNIVTISRGGSGTKYGMYSAYVTGNTTWDKNDYYINATAGNNYVGLYSGTANNLAALQTQGIETNGFSTDPMYTSIASQNYIPTSSTINNMGAPVGVYIDINNLTRSGTQPDPGAFEFLSANCVSTPSVNSVSPSAFTVCPGDNIQLGLANYYSDLGISYQWKSSTTSAVGPFTTILGATGNQYTTPNLNVNTWYSVVITCANGGGSISPVSQISIAGPTISSIPFHEGFEGITAKNKLPNCSWMATNLGTDAFTYTTSLNQNRIAHTGNKFATFYEYYVNGSNYFYTNGIQLYAGITYSASLWYQTDFYSGSNITDLSILYGPSQATTGLISIASTNGIVSSPIYKQLSNTFTVATSGIYYAAVRSTANGNYGTSYLSWDDLDITIPCSLNSPSMTVSTSTTVLCKNQSLNLVATGANTYTWSTGANGSTTSDSPMSSTTYSVAGSSTLSGCTTTLFTQFITVYPSPNLIIYATKPVVCAGEPVSLMAYGADTYVWNTSANTALITVTLSASTTFTAIGTNSYNCSTQAVMPIVVNQNPTVTVSASTSGQNQICKGEQAVLTGGGAVSYSWAANTLFIQSPVAIVNPVVATVYTLSGSDANGCVGKTTYALNVDNCTGIAQNKASETGVKLYPNPTAGTFVVETGSASLKTVEVTDLTGRVILSNTGTQQIEMNIGNLANGIYYVRVQSDNAVEVIKVVKQ